MRQNILTGVLALGFAVFAFVPGVSAVHNEEKPKRGGNVECSELGLQELAKYEFKNKKYVAERGGDVVEITNGTRLGGHFEVISGDLVVTKVIIKASTKTQQDDYAGVFEGDFENTTIKNKKDKLRTISNVKFCGEEPKDDGGNGDNGGQNGGATNGDQDEVDEEENGQVLSDQVDAPVSGEGVNAGGGAVIGAAAGLFTSLSGLGYGIRRFFKSE